MMTPTLVVTAILIVALGLVSVTLAGGALIAMIASRKAPDGFEDDEGFHVGRMPPRPRS